MTMFYYCDLVQIHVTLTPSNLVQLLRTCHMKMVRIIQHTASLAVTVHVMYSTLVSVVASPLPLIRRETGGMFPDMSRILRLPFTPK